MTGEKNVIVELEKLKRELKRTRDEKEEATEDYWKILIEKEAIIEAN